ncbi:MAG: VTT domain-containing protein [Acidobacteriota bacterium]|nr:VTT domain-containing protein [Acidobacteriota bacterium]MDH3529804.1 VTT domain-containing protein [Acidobacteriota bacterium]
METIIDFIYQFIDFIKPDHLINWLLDLLGVYVYFGLFFIVFAETGLALGFFLPGDSLLVVTGLMAKTLPDKLNIYLVITAFLSGSILGDNTGYWTGRVMGASLFKREDSFLFKPSRVEKAHRFFEKYGPKTIILARFVPIVRTFAPLVIGASRMPYATFLTYSVLGGLLWILSMVLAGFFLGGLVEEAFGIKLQDHIEKVVIVVVFLSLLPPIIEFLKHRFGKKDEVPQEPGLEVD